MCVIPTFKLVILVVTDSEEDAAELHVVEGAVEPLEEAVVVVWDLDWRRLLWWAEDPLWEAEELHGALLGEHPEVHLEGPHEAEVHRLLHTLHLDKVSTTVWYIIHWVLHKL